MHIKRTLQKKSDFSILENAGYRKEQHQEILLGKEDGLDVSLYSNPEFNYLQMEQIRMGIKDKIDVSCYADPTFTYETMKQIRLSIYSNIDLMPYLARGFVDDELEQIRLALEEGLGIDAWLTDDMYVQQIHEIRVGLYEGLDVSKYADSEYNWMQMKEIRLGLEKKLKVSCYTNSLFSHWQMKEIRLGLEAGLDVGSYARLIFSGSDMRKKRDNLMNEKMSPGKGGERTGTGMGSSMKTEFSILVEDNGNKVYAFIKFIAGDAVTEEDIYAALSERGIINGIDKKAISEMIGKKKVNEKVLIAEGTPAEDGKNGWFEFFVRLDLPRIPAPLPDGGVDYVNIEAFEMVDEGERIALYHPAEKGKDGQNVFGEVIRANDGTEKKPLKGEGFTIAQDGVTYISKMSGKFEFVNGQIIITNMLIVREDVTAVTGKLEVDGSVYVVGSVYSGGHISATGDIIVEHNVEAARLIAGGNVMIKKGSCSKNDCFIEAKGEVSGSFFEAANIEAGGNIRANYIMNSNINTLEKVIVSGSKGMLLGGLTRAIKGVDTYNLGNKTHIKTVLDIGKNVLYERQQEVFAKRRGKIQDELHMLEERWNSILQALPPDREQAAEMIKRLNAAIVAKDHEMADLDAEVSKLDNITGPEMKAVIVRGTAHAGTTVEINSVRYILPSAMSRIIFKLRGKSVVMVKL